MQYYIGLQKKTIRRFYTPTLFIFIIKKIKIILVGASGKDLARIVFSTKCGKNCCLEECFGHALEQKPNS